MGAVWLIVLSALSAPSGTIAYAALPAGQVVTFDLGAGAVTPVGPGAHDGAPQWSPDGQWLAFETDTKAGRGICVARADGAERRILRHEAAWNFSPRWSPDGARIAYSSVDSTEAFEAQQLRVYDLTTDAEATWGGGRTGLLRPVWLPNPRFLETLLYMLRALGPEAMPAGFDADLLEAEAAEGGLWCIGFYPQGAGMRSEVTLVTATQTLPLLRLVARGAYPYAAWAAEAAPNGKRIAYESNDGGDREIFVLSSKGTADLSNDRAADWNPVWSPGGRQIAFESFRGGRRGVYRVYADTGRVTPVAADAAHACWAPAWSPDGAWLAYVSSADGAPAIHVAAAEAGAAGTPLRQAGGGICAGYAPAWRPTPGDAP